MLYAKNSWKAAMIEHGLDQPEAQNGCPIAYSFDKEDVVELLGEKFDIETITQDHIFQYSIPEYKNHIYKKTAWFQAMPTMSSGHLKSHSAGICLLQLRR